MAYLDTGIAAINEPTPSSGFVTLARVVKAQGRRGEVAAEIHSDVPGRFAAGMRLLVPASRPHDIRRELEVQEFWPHKGLLVFKFAGVDSISDAEALVGSELQVPRTERAALEPGWNYVSDLTGCSLFDSGRELGTIEDVQFGAGEAPLLIVAASKYQTAAIRKFEIPFAEAYLEGIDLARRQVRMKLPEGLLQVNAPMTAEEKHEQALAQAKIRKAKAASPGTKRVLRET
ncbi:MAG TPA: ribosome maturation factor RimM [Candidatus Aquilonibacter sp.]|nr:ribosome maturation factor RimM [Candidatus Aquilonibacter sp.]